MAQEKIFSTFLYFYSTKFFQFCLSFSLVVIIHKFQFKKCQFVYLSKAFSFFYTKNFPMQKKKQLKII